MGGDKVGGVNLGADSKGKRPAVAVRYFLPLVCAWTNGRKQQTEQVRGVNLGANSKGRRPAVAVRYF